MAGGIDWFRWHHGSVTDPKFPLISRRANARLGDVIAVWAFLLEQASAGTDRGRHGDIDCEAIDCMLGADEGTTQRILSAMQDRKLIADGAVVAWEKRQPKKEDETANERKRRQREREHEAAMAGVTCDESRDVTACHTDVTPCHAREEESREEKREEQKKEPSVPKKTSAADAAPAQHVALVKTESPTKGTRLPKPWALPKSWGEWALCDSPHWTPDIVRRLGEGFADHWHSKAGKDATKTDWEATWRNWCRGPIAQRQYPKPVSFKTQQQDDALQSLFRRGASL